jgi:GH25 family lysozyme M1 (1,4-beta-N-acetylmuramidase)
VTRGRIDEGRLQRRPGAARTPRGAIFPCTQPALVAAVVALCLLFASAPGIEAADHNQPPRASVRPATLPAPDPTKLEGIDVSHWQGTIDWPTVAASGKRFVIMKATEGTGFVDPMYATNIAGARAAGIKATAYHFASPDATPNEAVAEADHFVDVAGLVDGDLVPALDLEVTGGLGTTALTSWVRSWLAQVTLRTGIRPMIYVSPAFWKKYLADTTWFAANGYRILWIAHWGVAQPTVPGGNWGGYGWTFWQYTNCGSVPGISGCVDLDRYNGLDLEPVTYHPGFRMSASPANLTTKQGRTANVTIGIARTTVTDPVTLSIDGLPAGVISSFTPNPVAGTSAALTIATTNSGTVTPTGTYLVTVTGSGGGLTRATSLRLSVIDGIPPTVLPPAPAILSGARLTASTTPVRIRWSGSDSSGISSYRLQRQANGGAWSNVALASATAPGTSERLTFGVLYRYRVSATDRQGNVSPWTYGRPFRALLVQQSSSAVRYGGSWRTVATSSASGGSLAYATSAGAWASYGGTAASLAWVGYKSPARGWARVYVDGAYVQTVSLYSKTVIPQTIAFAYNWGYLAAHNIKLVVVGTAGRPRVDVDAFIRLYFY